MIYCPKCGKKSEHQDGEGNAILSCSSCGVVWLEFLETMSDEALWPSIVKQGRHDVICPNCGQERYPSDEATPRTKCPQCRMSYSESLVSRPLEPHKAETKACEYCGEHILAVAKKCKHCQSMVDTNPPASSNGSATGVFTNQLDVESRASPDHPNLIALEWITDEVNTLLKQGKKVEAIERYRDGTGVGLKEARDHIDSLDVVAQGLVKQPSKATGEFSTRNIVLISVLIVILFGLMVRNEIYYPRAKPAKADATNSAPTKVTPKANAESCSDFSNFIEKVHPEHGWIDRMTLVDDARKRGDCK